VTGRVKQEAIGVLVRTAESAGDEMMTVPTGKCGDFLMTDGTQALLFLPQAEELPPFMEIGSHFDAQSLFEVEFPGGIEGVGLTNDFDVTPKGHPHAEGQIFVFAVEVAEEDPITTVHPAEVLSLQPAERFGWVATARPTP